MSTMPNVAVGWFSSLLGTLGTLWSGKLNIWEGIIYCQPIWDVFAPQWGRRWAGEQTTTRFRSLSFPIRQGVPVGLLWLSFAVGLVGLSFPWPKNCIILATIYLHAFQYFLRVGEGGNGWMELERFGCMLLSYLR